MMCMLECSYLIFHALALCYGRLTVQNGVVDGGEETRLCYFVIKETCGLQVIHHTA